MIKLPREDGAWYMALTCWVAGWAASLTLAWEPLVVAGAVFAIFVAAASLRRLQLVWLGASMAALLAAALFIAWRLPQYDWLTAVVAPGILYAPFIVHKAERRPAARVLAVAAFTAIAPVTHALAIGRFNAVSALLWGSLAGYYLVGALFIMARLRGSPAMLWVSRVASTLAVAAAFPFHWLLAAAFLPLALRAWLHRDADGRLNPAAVGRAELAWSAAAAVVILVGIWLSARKEITVALCATLASGERTGNGAVISFRALR